VPSASAYTFTPGRTEAFHSTRGQWVRDVVLGANDGLVTVMALVAGVAGAAQGRTVLVAGVAGLVAGAISMGLGAFVASRSYAAFYRHEQERERWEMKHLPEVEREEIRKIYRAKGFDGPQLEQIVDRITGDPGTWLEVMMKEELGLQPPGGHPVTAGLVMAASFAAGGIFPVVPFIAASGTAALGASIGVTGAALATAGALRSRITGEPVVRSSIELLGMAGAGVGVAYLIGRAVGTVV
jgi:VIT1/CCC1 family predicted Fe2+/Mn2+ transporter